MAILIISALNQERRIMTGKKTTRRSKAKGRKPAQAGLPFHRDGRWGGARPGAGRPALPEHRRKGVAHRPRRRLAASRPVHITVRLRPGLPALRSQRAHRQILRCFLAGKERFGFRLVHYSVQSTHLHLVCEAKHRDALSRGMQGLLIRLAKGLNKVWGRKGSVWAERYHAHVLGSPREVRNALAYVLNNLWRHMRGADQARHGVIDGFASGRYFDGWRAPPALPPAAAEQVVAEPHTWLLREGWRRHGLIRTDEVPTGLVPRA
jgi:REP element-mobilizing transposase RayT